MKALQYVDAGKPTITEAAMPEPEQDEVLVRIEAITTCPQWDLHIMANEPMFPGVPFRFPYPVGQPGHEAVGIVEKVGAAATAFAPGMRVGAWRDPGQDRPGSYAQYNVMNADNLLEIPTEIPVQGIAPLELAMCVQVTFDRLVESDMIQHSRVAVSGLGPAGLIAIQMAKTYGARTVVAIDPIADRKALAATLGADEVCSPGDPHIENIDRRGDDAFDIAVDCTGLKTSIEYLMDRTRNSVSIFGVLREELIFAPRHWTRLALVGYGEHNRHAAMRALDLIVSESIRLEPIVTHTMPLSRYEEGIRLLQSRQAIKVCFLPWEE